MLGVINFMISQNCVSSFFPLHACIILANNFRDDISSWYTHTICVSVYVQCTRMPPNMCVVVGQSFTMLYCS